MTEGRESVQNLEISDDDGDLIEVSISDGPQGLEIIEGMLVWTPSPDQIGIHEVRILLFDGYEGTEATISIEVIPRLMVPEPEDEGSSIPIFLIAILTAVVLIALGIGIFLFLKFRPKRVANVKDEVREASENERRPPAIGETPDRNLSDIFN
jgi:hypothetical protein